MEIEHGEDMDERVSSLEAENDQLTQKIKELEKFLDKQKKFHRKFVEDVTDAEEMRIRDFNLEKRDILNVNKQLVAENRQILKDKCFYQTAYNELVKEEENSKACTKNATSTSNRSDIVRTVQRQLTPKNSKIISKESEKLREENKKLKLKITKLTKDNGTLKVKLSQMDKNQLKVQNKISQKEADSAELTNLVEYTRRANKNLLSSPVLSELRRLSEA